MARCINCRTEIPREQIVRSAGRDLCPGCSAAEGQAFNAGGVRDASHRERHMPEAHATQPNVLGAVITLVALSGLAWFYFGGGLDRQTAKRMHEMEVRAAQDAVRQYEIVKRSGTATEACAHAGIAAEAYLQAKDEDAYRKWKATERSECAHAAAPYP